MAANVHGRGLRLPPFVGDLEAFTLVDPSGVVRRCRRTENAELFQLAVGGSIVGAALGGHSLRSLARWSVTVLIVGLVAAIMLQSIGYAPAPVIVSG